MGNEEFQRKLHNLAEVKDEAEQRLYRRIDFSLKVSRMVYAIAFAVVVAAVWLTSLQLQVRYNTRAVEKLWRQTFNYDLP